MTKIENQLRKALTEYNRVINNAFKEYWDESIKKNRFDEKTFSKLFRTPRNSFKDLCREKGLNYASFAGTILEWTLYHFLNAGLSAYRKTRIAEVHNRYKIRYKWKKGNKKVKLVTLDVVIKSKKSKKIYYAFEVKTNFEDGFEKYRTEERIIYHHRRKTFKDFRYYYLSLFVPPESMANKHKRDLNTLQRRKELYIINVDRNNYPGAEDFLESIKNAIQGLG
jgi:hypothetical protein